MRSPTTEVAGLFWRAVRQSLAGSWRRGCNSQACRNHVGPLSVAALCRFLKIHAAAVIFFCAGGAERLAKGVILLGKLLGAGESVTTTQCERKTSGRIAPSGAFA
jgi:hypothetical protein